MDNTQLKEIFNRYLLNRCSAAEVEMLVGYFHTDHETQLRRLIRDELGRDEPVVEDHHLQALADHAFSRLQHRINTGNAKTAAQSAGRYRKLWLRIAAAACLLLALGWVWYLTADKLTAPKQIALKRLPRHDIAPGGNKAVLILANGQKIDLNNAKNGRLAMQTNVVINKTADGKLIYHATPGDASDQVTYNTLKTPRGGNYDLTLADGTHVWLNAASSITYPSSFNGTGREVEVTGEVYFEVVHNAAKPFRVKVAGQVIEDIGTHFNINAYADEPSVKATLLEGSISVANLTGKVILKPGQQAVIHENQTITLDEDADMDEAVAWHHNLFMFRDASIETVMRQLSRWYDVDVSYEGNIPERRFSGKIYRNATALKVSDILSYKQIHFRLEGRRIIVMP